MQEIKDPTSYTEDQLSSELPRNAVVTTTIRLRFDCSCLTAYQGSFRS